MSKFKPMINEQAQKWITMNTERAELLKALARLVNTGAMEDNWEDNFDGYPPFQGAQQYSRKGYRCFYCDVPSDDLTKADHNPGCPWLEAKELLESYVLG